MTRYFTLSIQLSALIQSFRILTHSWVAMRRGLKVPTLLMRPYIGFSSSSTDRGKGKGKSKSKSKSGDEIESDSPFYVLSEDEGLTKSFTGRFTNEEIDVIHFEFSVIVANKDVVRFMRELCSSKEH